jgi:hypothetical protein
MSDKFEEFQLLSHMTCAINKPPLREHSRPVDLFEAACGRKGEATSSFAAAGKRFGGPLEHPRVSLVRPSFAVEF